MYKVLETPKFVKWLNGIKDITTQIRLTRRLDKARRGNLGGDKSSQSADIREVKQLAGLLED